MTRILVCDDAADLRMIIRLTLEMAGHEAIEADSGIDALRQLDTQDVDLVMLDVQMPGLDGWGVLRAIRENPLWESIPVVLCTVKVHDSDLAQGWAAGCDGYLSKPFDLTELSDIVTRILARSPMERVAIRDHNLSLLRSDTEQRTP